MRNVWFKRCAENQNAHFMLILLLSNRTLYKKKWKNIVTFGQARDDNMAHAHCMLDTEDYKHTLTECVILIAFPLQQSLHERATMSATMSRCTYITSLVSNEIWSFLSQSESHILTKNCSYIHIRWVRNRSKSNGISSCLIHPMSFILAHQ